MLAPAPTAVDAKAAAALQQAKRHRRHWLAEPLAEPVVARDDRVLVYLIKAADLPGKFDNARAQALGVPRGPIYARLVRGEAVTLADGRTIQPSDCVGAPRVGPVRAPRSTHMSRDAEADARGGERDVLSGTRRQALLFVYCPSIEFVDGLVRSQTLNDARGHGAVAVLALGGTCRPSTHTPHTGPGTRDSGDAVGHPRESAGGAQRPALHCVGGWLFGSCPRTLRPECLCQRTRGREGRASADLRRRVAGIHDVAHSTLWQTTSARRRPTSSRRRP